MVSGLLALLDDVVALSKVAAASLDDVAGKAVEGEWKGSRCRDRRHRRYAPIRGRFRSRTRIADSRRSRWAR